METLADCLICFDVVPPSAGTQLHCGCSFCEVCLRSYFITKTEDLGFQRQQTFGCPSGCAGISLSPEEALEQLQHGGKEELGNALLKVYLVSSKDIRACPRTGCKYFGILPKNRCRTPLQCDVCKCQWRDEALYTQLERIFNSIQGAKGASNGMLSAAYKDILTEECPRCSIAIYKNGGCPHMTCAKCRYEFCWHCKHRHHGHSSLLCGATVLTKVLLLFLMTWFALAVTGSLAFIRGLLFIIIKFTIQLSIFNSLPILGSNISYKYSQRKILDAFISLIPALGIMGVIYYFELITRCLVILATEAILVCIFGLIRMHFRVWIRFILLSLIHI
eukprot:TRINITY_DN4596_c0_g1_i2.p1 TRINITY_DN4596_c0_g1~~TRINITY_DN4596_c0_g1_i2.p1  ORF type:complete len:333 (+),score=3.98 TRINITY_DN4596_c0_g1_i2:132-1130(+)